MTLIPKSHPRYKSLMTRNAIIGGAEDGVTSVHGLLAHGRGEAFDYMVGEKTNSFSSNAARAAAAMLLLAKKPVISVNGNSAALAPKEFAELSKVLSAPLEVNVFHASKKREFNIKKFLIKNGAKNVLLADKKTKIRHLDSNRKFVNRGGILKADVVLVPLEDGDRTEALIKNGKKVIAVDLNPMSRTSQKADITIVDNIIRAMPLLIKTARQFQKSKSDRQLKTILRKYSNKKTLAMALRHINSRLKGVLKKSTIH